MLGLEEAGLLIQPRPFKLEHRIIIVIFKMYIAVDQTTQSNRLQKPTCKISNAKRDVSKYMHLLRIHKCIQRLTFQTP